MKIGGAPFHFWILLIIENLRWIKSLVLITWQKIGPFILLLNCFITKFVIIFIFFRAFFRALLGLNQISLQKIIGYSSINNIRWILGRILLNKLIWIIYFILYSFILIRVVFIFLKLNLFFFKSTFYYY